MLLRATQAIRSIDLNNPQSLKIACILVPVFFGLTSLWLGQDVNWDLLNYHFYNAYSLLNGKLNIDLAPAGFQTYFNPILDVPYYILSIYLPAPMVGFIMGALHGLNFVLLLFISLKTLENLAPEDRFKIPFWLAVAGCLTGNFLSELGNTMGDNTTALLVLSSILIIVWNWKDFSLWTGRTAVVSIFAGVSVGMATGLKLTNAIYALALVVSFLVIPLNYFGRIRVFSLFSVGTIFGIGLTGGYWLLTMWHEFGNPLFPQFGSIFPNPLAKSISVADTSFLPKNLIEYIFWPFIFSYNSHRIGQVTVPQIIWPILYSLFFLWLFHKLKSIFCGIKQVTVSVPSKFLLCFAAISYLLWMILFSIYRYVVPMELLAPLLLFLLLNELVSYRISKFSTALISITSVLILIVGLETWGHASWRSQPFSVEVPTLENPDKTTIVFVGTDPHSYLIPYFPSSVSFIQLAGAFPETPDFIKKAKSMIHNRDGVTYIITDAHSNQRSKTINNINDISESLNLSCDSLHWIKKYSRVRAVVEEPIEGSLSARCKFSLRPEDYVDLAAKDLESASKAGSIVLQHGLKVEVDSCVTYKAYVGKQLHPYQLCVTNSIGG